MQPNVVRAQATPSRQCFSRRNGQRHPTQEGRFTWPQSGDAQGKVTLSHEKLSLLLGGIE
jgi:hypothetical protein